MDTVGEPLAKLTFIKKYMKGKKYLIEKKVYYVLVECFERCIKYPVGQYNISILNPSFRFYKHIREKQVPASENAQFKIFVFQFMSEKKSL